MLKSSPYEPSKTIDIIYDRHPFPYEFVIFVMKIVLCVIFLTQANVGYFSIWMLDAKFLISR